MKKIVVIEPYFGGSHKSFLEGLAGNLPYEFVFHTLPARKWKWRMRLAAPYFAGRIDIDRLDLAGADLLLCSPFLDVAVFKGLLPRRFRRLIY